MDDQAEDETSRRLPRAVATGLQETQPVTTVAQWDSEAEEMPDDGAPSPMFDRLVADDRDVAGLVAYSLYKLSKREWMKSFRDKHRRMPTPEEIEAYIVGEATPRRVTTYRRLAEDSLRNRQASVSTSSVQGTSQPPPQYAQMSAPVQPQPNIRKMFTLLAMLAVAVVVAGLLIRYLLFR